MKKKMVVAAMAAVMSLGFAFSAYAGWEKLGDESWQWRYVHDDGSFTRDGYEVVNGATYHFNSDGLLDKGYRKFGDETVARCYNTTDGADIGKMLVNCEYAYGHFDGNGYVDAVYTVDRNTGITYRADGTEAGKADDWYMNVYRQLIAGCEPYQSTTHYEIAVPANYQDTCPAGEFISEMVRSSGCYIGAEFDYNWTINDGVLRVDYDIHG